MPKFGILPRHALHVTGVAPDNSMTGYQESRVAVLIPCHNEAATIAKVVSDFRRYLPDAQIYVYDNASTDDTLRVAQASGAIVRAEPLKGKGNVVRRMFADVDADIYLMVDGDGTYDAAAAPQLLGHLTGHGLDMVNCARVPAEDGVYRSGHRFGNRLLTGMVARVFGNRLRDMLSGYRVMSRRFVKSFPALSSGFEIETELTVHALELRVPIAELAAPYYARPEGSASKLNTLGDGMRILRVIVHLVKEERPLQFFSVIFALLAAVSVALGVPVVVQYLAIGLVPRLPTAVLATGLMILAFLSLFCGLVLDTVTRGRREFKRLVYLAADRWP
ncbi:MAG TPA: glycosyltransferase [Steroidobacteraceae bacterium]|nr:glycosyltransferase [Steroidobacteraceae bacterium]